MDALLEKPRQVNFRIGEEVKLRADAALRRQSMTPSQGMRLFYECIGRDDDRAKELLRILCETEDEREAQRNEREARLAAACDFRRRASKHFEELGLPQALEDDESCDIDALRALSYAERFGEVSL